MSSVMEVFDVYVTRMVALPVIIFVDSDTDRTNLYAVDGDVDERNRR